MGPTIDFQALIQGKRLQACSDKARLLFPYLFMGSNSLGRLELDIDAINDNILVAFKTPLSAGELWSIVQEYRDHHLMFVYRAGQQLWGQWFVKEGYLPKYVTRRDSSTPAPPEEAFKNWLNSYKNRQISEKPAFFQEVPETLGNFQPREEERGEEECSGEKRRKPSTAPASDEAGKKNPPLIDRKEKLTAEFEIVWRDCWSKRGKGEARRAFFKARTRGVTFEEILAAIREQGPGILAEAQRNQSTPVYLATWLNQERYDDEPLFAPANKSRAAPDQESSAEDWSFLDEPTSDKGARKHA